MLVTLLLVACAQQPSDDPRQAPDLSGEGLNGEHIDLAEHRGSVVIVAAWASWCTTCRAELPVLSDAQDRLGPDGLQVIGINLRDRAEVALTALEQDDIDLPSILDQDGTISVHWGVRGVPTTFLVDREGMVLEVTHGQVTEDWIEDVVAPAVRDD